MRNEQVAMLGNLDRAEERRFQVEGIKDFETGWKAIWNVDKKKLACIAGKQYKLVQHSKVVGDFMDVCKRMNLKAKYDIDNRGNRIFVNVKFEGMKTFVKKGEEFFLGFRLINSYDKTTGILIVPRIVRCVCDNGMMVPLRLNWMQASCFRHDQIREDVSVYMERALKSAVNNNEKLKMLVEQNMEDSMEWKSAVELLSRVIGSKKHFEAIEKKLPEKKDAKQKLSRWDMYNALTSYLSHDAHLAPTMESWLESKGSMLLMSDTRKLLEEFPVPVAAPKAKPGSK